MQISRILIAAALGAFAFLPMLNAANQPSGSELRSALRQVTLDPEQTYRVRELHLARGDIKIYLTEGVLSFVTPVAGRRVAALFTTSGVDAGDAEVLLLPPQHSERASLASFIKSPNLDEHLTSALFLFSDNTAEELLMQIQSQPVRKGADALGEIARTYNPVIQDLASQIDVRLVEALLDNHKPEHGFLYSILGGRTLGAFDVLYAPDEFEPISTGQIVSSINGQPKFQLWTSFRPRRRPPQPEPVNKLSDYQIDATIHPDLKMSVRARFSLVAGPEDGRILSFDLSDRLRVLSATIDDKPADVFQHSSVRLEEMKSAGSFLVISDTALSPGSRHTLEVNYQGSVIFQTRDGAYFVDERNAWYPTRDLMATNFDLTFRCPDNLRLVSTGEPVEERVENGMRIVHRKTQVPERFAGFNLGDYDVSSEEHNGYRIECYSNKKAAAGFESNLPTAAAKILDLYSNLWGQLPIHSVAISPIPGYFGQGFPGLIYLSTVSYVRQEERPAQMRNPRMDIFFSELLLPHEVAHQWWGNLVSEADYRSTWILEAMASDSALEVLKQSKGSGAVETVLAQYRDDLVSEHNGTRVDSNGPVDFGERLLTTAGTPIWHTIVYEKGTWILQMLRQRLGDEAFARMQLRLLKEYAGKPISNEQFRHVLSSFVPGDQPDKNLALFFDTWVYGTGIPKMRLNKTAEELSLDISGVDEDFTADIPLRCFSAGGKEHTQWTRASTGSNHVDTPPGVAHCELPRPSNFLYMP